MYLYRRVDRIRIDSFNFDPLVLRVLILQTRERFQERLVTFPRFSMPRVPLHNLDLFE